MDGSKATLLGVVLGAFLATLGSFAAARLGDRIERRRRASSAARLCGEVLAATNAILRLAEAACVGDIIENPMALRYLKAAQREVEIYFRNRELLFSMSEIDLRAQVHTFMIRILLTCERLFDARDRIHADRDRGTVDASPTDALLSEMNQSFRYLVDTRRHIPEILLRLERVAGDKFNVYDDVDADGMIVR